MRNAFDLNSVAFTEESDDETQQISDQLIQTYNNDYSLVLGETKNFFADCKDFLARFITLNNMGIGFNLPIILNKLIKVESQVTSPLRKFKKQSNPQKKKQQYQQKFMNIMVKMGEVIQEMLNFQIKIKFEYLGQAFNTQTKITPRINLSAIKSRIKNQPPTTSQKKKNKLKDDQQQFFRAILQKNMSPIDYSQQKVCQIKKSPTQNLEMITRKIDSLKTKIQSSKVKQQKIWDIFNEKRPSRNMFVEQKTQQQITEQKELKKISSMLSDIVSQKNKRYMSPFETVESSVH